MIWKFFKKEEGVKQKENPADPEPQPAEAASGFFNRLKAGLSKTRRSLSGGLDQLFAVKGAMDGDAIESLEELLITSDIGVETSMKLVDRVSKNAGRISSPDQLKAMLKEELMTFLKMEKPAATMPAKPHVVMVVGVNGVGKTTTIGKLAAKIKSEQKSVLIGAADTFRAAAVEQLSIWAERSGADIVKHKGEADPAAVAFDAVDAAIARNRDVVLIDTAGRLHTR
ncbi:MAG: signal recognition particle-docking protein FtsY, partial [Desulfobacteraceae bacterium]